VRVYYIVVIDFVGLTKPCFLYLRPGSLVAIQVCDGESLDKLVSYKEAFWIGHVISVIGSARDPDLCSLFQVLDIDSGFIKTVNADVVMGVLRF